MKLTQMDTKLDTRLAGMDTRLAGMNTEIAGLRGEVRLVQALCGVNTLLIAGVLWRLLTH